MPKTQDPASSSLRLFFCVSTLVVCGMVMMEMGWASDGPSEKKIDILFSSVKDGKSSGVAVLVRKNGKTVFKRGYGVRELRTKATIDAQTNFRLASFTKQFTAIAVMLLVHDGKLRYDETLTEIFPEFPQYGKMITVRNLLNHTSGLPDYEDLMEAAEKGKEPIWTEMRQIQDEEVLALLETKKNGKFQPGTNWAYSNSGYVVLGLVVAKISGKSFGEFLHERIFASLKMDHTIVFQKGKNEVANRAFGHTGYLLTHGGKKVYLEETDQSATSATLGDGGVYSNLEDLAKWDNALRNHTLLSAEEMKPALTPVKLADGSEPHWPTEPSDNNLHPGKPVSYGFGWFLDPYQGQSRMYHDGGTMGFRTTIQRFADDKLTVIVLCNRTDLDPEKLALQVADIFFSTKN